MTAVFAVIGARRDDPSALLLLGDDGAYYACPDPERAPTPVEPDNGWALDPAAEAAARDEVG